MHGVSINVGKAISTAQVKFKKKLGPEAIRVLDGLKVQLARPTLDTLRDVIKLAQAVMVEHDIYPV